MDSPAIEDTPLDLFSFTLDGLRSRARDILPAASGSATRLFRELYATGSYEPESLGLNAANSAAWRSAFAPRWLEVLALTEEEGPAGVTKKALLGMADGLSVEIVLIPMDEGGRGRASLCLSTQAGCRMACAFCQTGRSGLSRNLSAGQIVSEVMTARFRLGWSFTNIVFMGMGEPLDNLDGLLPALDILTEQSGARFDAERITVCTCGIVEGMKRLGASGRKRLGLSISLNAANDGLRSRLMPVNRREGGLDALAEALRAYPRRRNFVLGLNWCLLPLINDSAKDAREIAAFAEKVGRCLVNVIPYNPGEAPIASAPTEDEVDAFIYLLREEGLAVRRRVTKGRSIMAACGQLGALIRP